MTFDPISPGTPTPVTIDTGDLTATDVGHTVRVQESATNSRGSSTPASSNPTTPVPVVLLAPLAVDVSVTGRGLGAWLPRDAMLRTLSAAETIGFRAMLAHAIDDDARRFYRRHGLELSPSDPMHLMILLKDIAASSRAADGAPASRVDHRAPVCLEAAMGRPPARRSVSRRGSGACRAWARASLVGAFGPRR